MQQLDERSVQGAECCVRGDAGNQRFLDPERNNHADGCCPFVPNAISDFIDRNI